jgi:hypothetical protein
MEHIGGRSIRTFLDKSSELVADPHGDVRKSAGYLVSGYIDLVERVAELQFANPAHLFLFRGQSREHRNINQRTMIRPSLVRGRGTADPTPDELRIRFAKLKESEERLRDLFNREQLDGRRDVARYRVRRWAILQHYEICDTPLLDVTSNLRIAASFATNVNCDWGYLYVLGVPHLAGAITASVDASVEVMRLASICPPISMRPHIQEGFLLGEYPELIDLEAKGHYRPYELDFGRRLVAKFRFDPKTFWRNSANFPQIERAALFPDDDDKFYQLAKVEFGLETKQQ